MRARRYVHRGSVLASGLILNADESQLRKRALQAFAPGTRVYRRSSELIVIWPAPRRMHLDRAPGAPLTLEHERYLAAPLSEREIAAIAKGAVVRFRAGRLESFLPGPDAPEEDLADWLELPSYAVVTAHFPTLSARLQAPEAPPDKASAALGVQRTREADELFASRDKSVADADASTAGARRSGDVFGALVGLPIGALSFVLRKMLKSRHSPPGKAPPPLELAQHEGAGFGAALRRFLLRLDLFRLVSRSQAQYMRRVLEMFSRGDLSEALRHAPGLGSVAGALDPAFRIGPRQSLHLTGGGGAASILPLDASLMQLLEAHYRRAVERLKQAGRFKEAAFVHAELLGQPEVAIELLEEAGMYATAADLAEARKLSPGLIVRLRVFAGEFERAIAVAVLHNAFHDAVARLENALHKDAKRLRLLWAERLAESGNFVLAADVVRAANASEQERSYLDSALALGGDAGVRAQARRLHYFEEDAGVYELLRSDAGGLFVRELLQFREPAGPRTLACVRAAVRLAAAGELDAPLASLLIHSRSAVLKEDFSRLRQSALRKSTPEYNAADYVASQTGVLYIYDAALLPRGRILVALGEAGVRLYAADGQLLHHFESPAEFLALSDSGARAIGVASRGSHQRLTRLDLVNRTASHWETAQFEHYTDSYDGELWFVGGVDGVYALDAQARDLRSLWKVDEPPLAIHRSSSRMYALLQVKHGRYPELFEYELPGVTLRSRTSVQIRASDEVGPELILLSNGALAGGVLNSEGAVQGVVWEGFRSDEFEASLEKAGAKQVLAGAVSADGMAALLLASNVEVGAYDGPRTEESLFVLIVTASGAARKRINLVPGPGGKVGFCSLRWRDRRLIIAGADGRALVYNDEDGSVQEVRLE